MQQYVRTQTADLYANIESTKNLDADSEKALTAAIEAFKKSWQ